MLVDHAVPTARLVSANVGFSARPSTRRYEKYSSSSVPTPSPSTVTIRWYRSTSRSLTAATTTGCS